MWFYKGAFEHPHLNVAGGSNYSLRSFGRDTEMQFYFWVSDDNLRQKFDKEAKFLFDKGHQVEFMTFQERGFKLGIPNKILSRLLKNLL